MYMSRGGALKIEMSWQLADDAFAIENHSKKKNRRHILKIDPDHPPL